MPYANQLDIPQFFSADVCRAAGIDAPTLKNWISRTPPAIIMGESDRKAETSGRPHLFTFRRAMQIAITAELVRVRVPPRHAGLAAAQFTDTGDNDRAPGHHFAEGDTYLVLHPHTDRATVFNALPGTDIRKAIRSAPPWDVHSATIVDVGELEFMVRARLGLPREVFRGSGEA